MTTCVGFYGNGSTVISGTFQANPHREEVSSLLWFGCMYDMCSMRVGTHLQVTTKTSPPNKRRTEKTDRNRQFLPNFQIVEKYRFPNCG